MYDLIFNNANVVSMDPAVSDGRTVAVEGGRIAVVAGSDAFMSRNGKGSRVVDCRGRSLLPGFIDAHCHVPAYAESLVSLNLSPRTGIRSIPDMQHTVSEYCRQVPRGGWIRGKGYNEFYLKENRHPNRWDLDAAAPENPVKLTHRSGHAHVLNSLALEYVGIDQETEEPPGGIIERDLETGLPSGILYGMGGYLARKIPGFETAEIERGLYKVNTRLLSCGITSVQDVSFSNDLKRWKQFESWKERNIFQSRLTVMIGSGAFIGFNEELYASRIMDTDLRLGGVKVMADRVAGSLRPSRLELNEQIASIHSAGFQAVIHAIEEPVIEAGIDAIEFGLKREPRPDSRHRIEHCSVSNPLQLQKLAALGGMVVTQPSFLYYEGERYLKTVPPDQLERLYDLGAMIQNGLRIGSGSDFPLVDPNPLVSIGAAVTRRCENGSRLPGRGMDLSDAIRMHTLDAAAACFEENIKGSISPGKMADLVLLSDDPFTVSPDRIKDIRVVMTIIGGRIVWDESE